MPTPALPLLLALALLVPICAPVLADEPKPAGQVTGGKMSTHPDWFKESFLDIAEDVGEAAGADRHVILFMEMNGCPYCYKMIEENFRNAPYRDFIQQHFDVIPLNVKGDREVALDARTSVSEKEVADRLGVRFTPTLVFLSPDNKPVARVSGYRNVDDFKKVLDYVAEKAYETATLAEYLDAKKAGGRYSLQPHPQIQDIKDLNAVADRPLALLFEDSGCVACAALHEGHLADPEVNEVLKRFTLVRLDADSDTPIVAPGGDQTTPRALAATLGVEYLPTIVLFDQGREIARIESMLYRYHFLGMLEYVGNRKYLEFPDGPFDYINAKTAELTAAGKDVSVADE